MVGAEVGMRAVWLVGPKTVIAWSHQQCGPSDSRHWSGQPCNWSCGMGVEPLLAVGRSHNWWNPGGAHLLGGRWGWSRRRRNWSGASVGRWGRSQRQRDWCGTTEPKGRDWSGQIGAEGSAIAWSSWRWCGGGSLRRRCGCSLSGHVGSVVGA